MKSLIIAAASIMAFTFSTSLNAQMAKNNDLAITETAKGSASEEVAILQDFKANKTQKRVIKKIKKYVTPRMFAKGVRTTALEGKTVTVQLNLDAKGAITNMQIVKGFEDSLDAKVMKYIKEYSSENPLANSKLDLPAIIQVEVPLVGKSQYMN